MGLFDPVDFSQEGIPEQPDGIEDDSYDVPEPKKAAKRAYEFISEFGDGIVMACNKIPLYSRDIETLRRTALKTIGDQVTILELDMKGFNVVAQDGSVALYHHCGGVGGTHVSWVDTMDLKAMVAVAEQHFCESDQQGLGSMYSEHVHEALGHLEEAASHLQKAAENLAALPEEKARPLIEALMGSFVREWTKGKKEE